MFAIALGYEDLNDHDELRHDPMMAVLAGKLAARREECAPVAGKSTLNRLELSRLEPTRYHKISHNPIAIKRLLVDLFLEAHERAPSEIILDLDATDDPVHGEQEGRFFHGYYDCYCYLPLYIFCGRDLLAAQLRSAGVDAAAGAVEEVARISRLPRTNRTNRNYARAFFGGASDVSLDKQGRLPIPPALRAFAGLDKDVVVVGVSDRIEIWEAGSWQSLSSQADDLYAGIEESLNEEGI